MKFFDNNKPILTIITPCIRLSNLPLLAQSIESSGCLDYFQLSWRIIIDGLEIKNNSEIKEIISKNYIQIEYLHDKESTGGAAQRNAGIESTYSGYIYFLDDDNLMYPDFAKEISCILNNDKEILCCAFNQQRDNRGFNILKVSKSSFEIENEVIDTAQFLVRRDAIGEIRWELKNRKKDRKFIRDIWYKLKGNFLLINKTLCYYNGIQFTRKNTIGVAILTTGQPSLPITLAAILNQTYAVDKIYIFDYSKQYENACKMWNSPLYTYLLDTISLNNIQWNLKIGFQNEDVKQFAVKKCETEWIWFIHDYHFPTKHCLEHLVEMIDDDVGAIGGLIIDPNKLIKEKPKIYNKIDYVNDTINAQYFLNHDNRNYDVDYLNNSYLFRKISSLFIDENRAARIMDLKEDIIFTYNIKKKGLKVYLSTISKTLSYDITNSCTTHTMLGIINNGL